MAASGCAAAGERALRADLARAGDTLADLPPAASEDTGERAEPSQDAPAPSFDGTPQGYVDYALLHSHELRAAWERWRAATHRIARERRLPMPKLEYAIFVSPVETRVGPQRHRLAVRQRFPWPGELVAGADAAAATARASQREFEAAALEVRARVLRAYWRLWLVRRTRGVAREQLELYAGMAELARGRVEVGQAELADVQQIDLGQARLADQVIGFDELEREAAAALIAALAAPPDTPTPTLSSAPALELPEAEESELRAALNDHPRIDRWQVQAEAGDLRVKEARNARAPSFSVGVDWIEVGPARTEGVADSGKDAVMIGVGLELPLWQRNYAEDQRAAEAEAAAARSEWASARDRATAELGATLARLRDSARRAALHEHTLLPQAEGALESTMGSYASGQGQLSAVFLAQRALLELELELLELHAAHAVAWAELERVVGRGVAGVPAQGHGVDANGDGAGGDKAGE
nr:TolC family protein [Pseudenhygromyxa sp. WMMC2535]